ncbi:hypothetical protein IFVP182_C160315 [Vibrio parahaemolyticus]
MMQLFDFEGLHFYSLSFISIHCLIADYLTDTRKFTPKT